MRAGDLMSLEEAAACFPGKHVRWVREKLCAAGRVDWVRISGTRFVVRRSLEAYIASQTRKAHRRAW